MGQISAETRMLPSQAMELLESLSNKGLVNISRNRSDAISGVLVEATPNALQLRNQQKRENKSSKHQPHVSVMGQ